MTRTRCGVATRGIRLWPASAWRRLLVLWGFAPPPFFAAFDEAGMDRPAGTLTARRREPRHR